MAVVQRSNERRLSWQNFPLLFLLLFPLLEKLGIRSTESLSEVVTAKKRGRKKGLRLARQMLIHRQSFSSGNKIQAIYFLFLGEGWKLLLSQVRLLGFCCLVGLVYENDSVLFAKRLCQKKKKSRDETFGGEKSPKFGSRRTFFPPRRWKISISSSAGGEKMGKGRSGID